MSKRKINPEKWDGKTRGKRFYMVECRGSFQIETLLKAHG
jgi:hypothetical protein